MSAAPRLLAWLAAGAVASITLTTGCKGPVSATCPTGDVCVPAEVARAFRQTPEEQLSCPSYITWGVDAGAAPPLADLPPTGEGSIDREGTRKRREAAGTDICCYRWYVLCPPS